ncbi:inositol hexakisphosphate and diphosphoinositol-pentakisphosphate kinase 2 isoform X29 [Xiphophorus couchianus]|uniref:inositol hexakisphosphate and diphosphoinositol-pentakisphosphate kinase 2 isoform X29 n=1 Tax=Xiphophorus couchianus TaxID=32473 RepID=UPI0010160829|nr:inositol hexakisphosphate and diphosphoinositol-pentakisphosphate kinase 1 isoform X29 [Xiphophorus couchianus]
MSEPNSPGESQRGAPRFYVGCEDDESEVQEDSMRTDMDLYEDDEDTPPERQIVVGICCMMKKSKSKPMTQILERLCRFEYITVVIFPEDTILNEPVDKWPLCDCLISFHSKGFPLDNAVSYAKLRSPLFINDLNMQYYIQDRREVYRILQEEGIELPRYAVLNRDPAKPNECNLVEGEDHVEVNGEIFQKPFVEKPVCAEDHNVYIYYPTSAGGGSQRLFRKIGSRSSVYSPESSVRKTGSYIYEEFMPTDGTDVKVYTVGPDYAHAEARKSPALDGKVERDSEGKEVRYPVILSAMEKLVARKVCLAFKQTVCGFDLLRANGHSYVCDVNGFSFVKNSMKYYDDCAKILGNIVMRELAPQFQIPWSIPTEAEDIPIVPTTSGTMMELRSVIAVIRHGDRTPKQKMKMEVRNPMFFDLFEKYDGYKTGKLKLKKPKQLQEVLDITRQLLIDLGQRNDCEIEEKKSKLEQLKTVLEMYGHFSGINRKVQLTYLPHGQPKTSSEDEDTRKEGQSLLLVLKWGGELTPAGRVQAEELGRAFRCIYPGGQGDYAGFPGCGLLRLHSTYRHDLKIYASDEGRVQMTAASFAKGLLALEGELTPILVQMVKSANMNGLLDNDSDSLSSCQHRVKARLHEILQRDREFNDEDYDRLAPTCATSLLNSMKTVKNPVATCDEVYTLIQSLTSQIRTRMENPNSSNLQLYHSETLELMLQRWSKLEKDFRMKNGRYDISKIPDIYDCVKYDVIHNATLGLKDTQELFRLSRALADIVIPQEYGINRAEKLDIAYAYCLPLVRKIQLDLQRTHGDEFVNKLHPLYSRGVLSPGRHVRTRLYFTSESHVHSLLSIFRYGSLLDEEKDQQWKRAMDYLNEVAELNYMTQIVIMLYEDNNKDISSEERFHVELHFSPGVKGVDEDEHVPHGFGFRPASSEVTRQNGQKKEERSSLEDLTRDETDRAVPASEPITIQKRSPLIRNHKTGSMEVLSETSSSKVGNYRLFSISRQSPEMKQSGLGSQCAGLFSTTVLGGSSSAPNLQDYARAHRKKYSTTSLSYKDEQIRRDEARRIERGRKQGAAIEQKRRDQVRRIDRGKKLDSVSELSKREAAKKREKDKKEELVELSKREVAKKSEKREKRWKSETDKTEESEYSGKEEAKKREKRERDKKEESELGKREVVKKRERSKTEESEQSGKEESKKSEKREKREKREKSEEEKKEGSELSKRDVAKKSEKHEKSETDKAEEPEQSGKEETKKSEKTKEPVQLGKREVAKKSEKRQKIEEDKKEEPEQSGKEETKKSETDKPEDSEDGGNAEDENRKKDSAPEDEDPELLSMPAVKRFSVSFAKHPTNGTQDDSSTVASSASRLCSWTESVEEHHVAQLLRFLSTDLSSGCRQLSLDHALAHHLHQCSYHLRLFRNWLISGQDPLECLHGFEGCSMVPSIYPLETLHNSLSLRQVNEFLTRVCESAGDTHTRTSRALSAMLGAHNQPDIPQRILTTSMSLKSRSDRPPWYSSGPSSTVSSAGPSSPTTADTSPRFSFSDKVSLTPQSSEETHSSQNASAQPLPAEVPLTPNNSPEEEPEPDKQPDDPEPAADGQEASCDTLEPVPEQGPACVALAELSLGRMEGYCLPGSLPVLLELRESSSEAGSSSQTPQSPEGPDEFFDTQESVELWTDSPENAPQPDTAQDPEPAQPVEQ